MFSANENITLRQDKRRIIAHVEESIPDEALDMGTTVMVMQVSCRAPGCVPLETLICIVFPKCDNELLSKLPQSRGGTFKTKILKPMSEVTKQDVLESLPPEFPGGQRSMSKLCIQARDVMLSQITQIMGEDDLQGRQLMAEYLQQCLATYIAKDCVAPEWGQEEKEEKYTTTTTCSTTNDRATNTNKDEPSVSSSTGDKNSIPSNGNFVIRRVLDEVEDETSSPTDNNSIRKTPEATKLEGSKPKVDTSASSNNKTTASHTKGESATDWRRRQTMENQVSSSLHTQQSLISRIAEREHAPGVRRPGCPCCDPDSASNYIDSMMMM